MKERIEEAEKAFDGVRGMADAWQWVEDHARPILDIAESLSRRNGELERIGREMLEQMGDREPEILPEGAFILAPGERWRPSIHLHKHNARIWLRITDIRQEYLGKMTEADALREGVTCLAEFRELWLKLHGAWNPACIVQRIEFRRIELGDLLSGDMDRLRQVGIIFSQPMVLAILDERKDVTRRIGIRYRKGDILWVRETWGYGEQDQIVYRAVAP